MTLRAGQLRAAARLVGVRIEVPEPRTGRALAWMRALDERLKTLTPLGLVAVQGASVELPDGDGATPGLVVCPVGFLASDERLLHPRIVRLVAEVTELPGTPPAWAAEVRVRACLLVDPRDGGWALWTRPGPGRRYRQVERGPWCAPLPPDCLFADAG
ncbi:hypothetical protein PJ985_21985 [Streptomyces sp. ACA25]|uniref:hypothetical protein n=1 Tax=Streptomyces sp. ACA25 TaxID=3022596 RepID=UPI0023071C0C|nr:hypothetical protein [Streptomyces sp. ACA25]MDB1090226.1 hypothetical protein [Streptomyces sp. ACA25]